MTTSIISASILAADFTKLGDECNAVIQAGAQHIHFDVMDHHFVPNLSFGAVICKSLREAGFTAPIDVHLMVTDPENYIEPFAKCGANLITFHPETVADPRATCDKIRQAGMQTGLAFNPDKPVNIDDELLASLDMVLLMSVFPGFGGQQFIPETLQKISDLRERLNALNANTQIGIDGGIKVENIGTVAQAGADFFVVGSGLFAAEDYQQRIVELFAQVKS